MIIDKYIPQIKKQKFFRDCHAYVKIKRADFKDLSRKREPINIEREKRRLLPDTKIWPDKKGTYVSVNGTGSGRFPNDELNIEQLKSLPLKDGDRIYLKRDEIVNTGEYVNNKNGIVFEAYGTGVDPIWSGASDASTLVWTDEGGGQYSTPMEEPNWVWINGVCAKNAETPRFTVQGRADETHVTVTHANVSGYASIVDAYLVMKVNQFRNSQRVKVTAYNGAGSITIDGNIPTANNIDFVLYNKREFLSGNNEWAWEGGMLYVKAAASPSTMDIKVSSHNYAIRTTGSMTIRNIEFKEYYNYVVHSDGGVINVNNCYMHDCRDAAFFIQRQVTGLHIDDNTFERFGNTCILTRPCINSTYNRNTGDGIGMQSNYGWQTYSGGPASSIAPGGTQVNGAFLAYVIDLDDDTIDGSGCEANDNVINNTAYNGLGFHVGATSMKMLRNTVTQFTRRFSDGGGIYTFHYRTYNVLQTGTEIANNICVNNDFLGYGIYIDNRSFQTNIHDNVTAGCKWGFNFNTDTAEHTITDNISVNCTVCYTFRSGDNGTLFIAQNEGNTFNNNTAAAYITTQRCLFFDVNTGSEPTWNPFTLGGADNNSYISAGASVADSDNKGNNLTFAGLQTAYGEDATSAHRTDTGLFFAYNVTSAAVNGNAGAGFETFAGVDTDAYSIPAHYAIVLLPIPSANRSIQLVEASSQYLQIGTEAEIQFESTSPMSVSKWFRLPSTNPATTVSIMENRNGSGVGFIIQVNTSGVVIVQMINTLTTNRAQWVTSGDRADGAWHHILFTKGATIASAKLYIDDVLLAPTLNNNLVSTIVSTSDWLIGRNPVGGTYTNMHTDKAAIWKEDVSAIHTEIFGATDLSAISIPPLHAWEIGEAADLLDIGTSATPLNITAVNSPAVSTNVP